MHVVTLIAPPAKGLTEARVRRMAAVLGAEGWRWLAVEEAADLGLERPPSAEALAQALAGDAMDAVSQPLAGRAKKLLLADMDSTLVTTETLDELAAEAGRKAEIAAITERSMAGTMDFAQALRLRVAMLAGLEEAALARTWAATRLMPGAQALFAGMRAQGGVCAIVSGGFTWFTERLAARLGAAAQFGNRLEIVDGRLSGRVAEPIFDAEGKRRALLDLASRLGFGADATMAVGDGANDLAMLAAAGMGVAFRAKPVAAAAARARIDHGDLRALLFIQGLTAPRDARN